MHKELTKVRLVGLETIDLPIIGATHTDRYVVKYINGLGPPESDVAIANTVDQGGVYQGIRTHNRQVVAHIMLRPDYWTGETVRGLRQDLYSTLNPNLGGTGLRIQLMNESDVMAWTWGRISKFEIVPFAEEPAVQITIDCPNSYFEHPEAVEVVPSTINNAIIENHGDAPTGFVSEVELTASTSYWMLRNQLSYESLTVSHSFNSGDHIILDTRPGSRSVTLVRLGYEMSLIGKIAESSVWPMLYKGTNRFYPNPDDMNWISVRYTPKYWGV